MAYMTSVMYAKVVGGEALLCTASPCMRVHGARWGGRQCALGGACSLACHRLPWRPASSLHRFNLKFK